ncbi:paraquat-inducible protein A [Trinickia dinghuensis]|uniref:Paraquat-inducible protein A n=1 Tax=Trinickia dinghuensis TaxID=2291023 RepID=A0A3D8JTV7_9BURK|nr:paraquat-inducible protein A [Trinickia dinghuensis]RDU96004.1 paraquat-inducible protein A [Trinickia dinghuensis]
MTIGCPECGALEDTSELAGRTLARCRVCHYPLERTSGRSVGAALACSLTTFVLLLPGNLSPLMTVHLLGAERSAQLGTGIVLMWKEGFQLLAVVLGMTGIVLPIVRFSALSVVLSAVLLGWRPRWLGRCYRWTLWLDAWAMPDVFLIGCFVGYSRVTQQLTGSIDAGGYCFIAAAFMSMLTRATLDRRTVWRAIAPEHQLTPGERVLSCTACDLIAPVELAGHPCPRCALTLRKRKPGAISRAAALSVAAFVLAFPANFYPMTISYQLGHAVTHRIVDGVAELFQAGLWPFGILIFCTSIAIPFVKLAGIAWFVASVLRRSDRHLRTKTHLYRLIDELGRWSNVDVFTIAAFVPLIRFDGIANARPYDGATAFALVVILTMAASRAFDPRLMWDAAQERHAQAGPAQARHA